MNYKVSLEIGAKNDFLEAYQYHKKISKKVATKFQKEIKYAISQLEIGPFYRFRTEKHRAYPLKTYPYLIFYELDEQDKNIYIIAIFNTNQNTSKYPK